MVGTQELVGATVLCEVLCAQAAALLNSLPVPPAGSPSSPAPSSSLSSEEEAPSLVSACLRVLLHGCRVSASVAALVGSNDQLQQALLALLKLPPEAAGARFAAGAG